MTIDDIDKIAQLIKNGDFSNLKTYVEDNTIAEENIEQIYEKIMYQIEDDSTLMEHFKEVAKKDFIYKELIHYCHLKENTKFFIDNYEEYGLNYEDMNKMRAYNDKIFWKNNKKNFESVEDYIKKTSLTKNQIRFNKCFWIMMLIISIILILKPFVVTSITKQAEIVNATIITSDIKEYRNHYSGKNGGLIIPIYIDHYSYEYFVDDVRYNGNGSRTFLFPSAEKDIDEVKIYYYKNNPEKSESYQVSIVGCFLLIISLLSIIANRKIRTKGEDSK